MKILFVAHRLPYPLDRGDRVRLYNIARVLSKNHDLTLLSFYEGESEKHHLAVLRRIFTDIHLVRKSRAKSWMRTALALFRNEPLQVANFCEPRMFEKAVELLDKGAFDMVYAYHLRMAQYIDHCKGIYTVLDLVDAISLYMQRMCSKRSLLLKPALWLEWRRVCRYEREITKRFNEYWIVSSADRTEVKGYEDANIHVIPQAIDRNTFIPGPEPTSTDLALLFVGYMGSESVCAIDYFAKDIWPVIKQHFPTVKFYIVGAKPPASVRRLEEDPNIVVTGFVESLVEYYRKATVVIAPMRFVAGMQTKIVEAMAMRKPVVATTWSNEGIDGEDGTHLFIGDTPQEFALHVIRLLEDKQLRMKMGRQASDYAEHFSWLRVAERVADLEHELGVAHRERV